MFDNSMHGYNNVALDDEESLVFADESEWADDGEYEEDDSLAYES